MPGRTSFKKKLAVALLSTLVALGGMEFGFRWLLRSRFERKLAESSNELWRPVPGSDYLYGLQPGARRENRIADVPGATWSYRIDQHGHRFTANAAGEDAPDAIRVVALGDSYTFGWAVDDEHAYPARLAALLEERYPDQATTVVNAGIPGFNTWQQAAYLEENWARLDPDVVVLGFVMNDAEPTRIVPMPPDVRYRDAHAWLWEDLKLRLGLVDGVFPSRILRKRSYLEQFAAGAPERRLCRESLERIATRCDAEGVPLRLIIFPDVMGLRRDGYVYAAIHEVVASWGEELGVPTLDLAPAFEGQLTRDVGVEGDGHPGPRALEVFARRILADLETVLPR